MADAKSMIIVGTSMLERFLSTIDYPQRRFILTPRALTSLCEQHYQMLSQRRTSLPFHLWGSHFMFARWRFAGHDSLNLSFNSGLCAMANRDGQLKQASFTASTESLLKWGFDRGKTAQNTFFPTTYSLEVAGLSQPNTLVWYDSNLEKDRYFGGIRINGLISHAWLKNYSWTIDFARMEYCFGAR